MPTAPMLPFNALLTPGIYVEEIDGTSVIPDVTRQTAQWALNQLCQRELAWLLFQKNHPKTWAQVIQNLRGSLVMLWMEYALQGKSAQEAFFIRCDMTTMTPEDIQEGTLICLVGMAPVKPSEFVTFRIRIQLSPRP